MGTVVEFPAARRGERGHVVSAQAQSATILILPVIRIERHTEETTSNGDGPRQGTAPRGNRRRRARS